MRQPFCILSTGRCGTTLLHDILRQHPKIALTNEGKMLDFLVSTHLFARIPSLTVDEESGHRGMINVQYNEDFGELYLEASKRLLEEFYVRHFPDREFTHWGDKMLSLTLPGQLAKWWPEMKVIVQTRDPRDVVCSQISFIDRHKGRPEVAWMGELNVTDYAHHWRDTYSGLAEHLPGSHVLRYEDLISDPEATVTGALEHLGLSMDDDCRREIVGNKNWKHHGTSGSPQQSLGRWRTDLSAEDLDIVQSVCGELMPAMGYQLQER